MSDSGGRFGVEARRRSVVALVCATVALAAVGGCAPGSSPPEPNPPLAVDRLVSTADGSIRLRTDEISVARERGTSTTTTSPRPVDGRITVDADQRGQVLDGFGASLTETSATLLVGLPDAERHRALRAMFDPDTGAGLSIVRLVIGASDFASSAYTYDDSPIPDPDLDHFTVDRDRSAIIPIAREIARINPDVTFMATPWSPPAWMKDSKELGKGRLLREYEPVLARYLVRFVEEYAAAGIDVRWLTIQNEPQLEPLSYPGMLMDSKQQATFLADDLGPAIEAAGLRTKVLVFDHNWDDPDYPLEVLRHERAVAVAAGVAFHCYRGDQVEANERIHDALGLTTRIWQTECTGGSWQGDRSAAFLGEADLFVDGLEHWANASLLWNLALDPDHGPHTGGCGTCRGVITVDGDDWTGNLDLDVLTQVSRWAPAGSVHVRTTSSGVPSLSATALRTGQERLVLIVANSGAERAVSVRAGDLDFRVVLPARSLTTLRWQA